MWRENEREKEREKRDIQFASIMQISSEDNVIVNKDGVYTLLGLLILIMNRSRVRESLHKTTTNECLIVFIHHTHMGE